MNLRAKIKSHNQRLSLATSREGGVSSGYTFIIVPYTSYKKAPRYRYTTEHKSVCRTPSPSQIFDVMALVAY